MRGFTLYHAGPKIAGQVNCAVPKKYRAHKVSQYHLSLKQPQLNRRLRVITRHRYSLPPSGSPNVPTFHGLQTDHMAHQTKCPDATTILWIHIVGYSGGVYTTTTTALRVPLQTFRNACLDISLFFCSPPPCSPSWTSLKCASDPRVSNAQERV